MAPIPFTLTVVQAKLRSRAPAYVEIKYGQQKTRTQMSSKRMTWNASFQFFVDPTASEMKLILLNPDDKFIGRVQIDPSSFHKESDWEEEYKVTDRQKSRIGTLLLRVTVGHELQYGEQVPAPMPMPMALPAAEQTTSHGKMSGEPDAAVHTDPVQPPPVAWNPSTGQYEVVATEDPDYRRSHPRRSHRRSSKHSDSGTGMTDSGTEHGHRRSSHSSRGNSRSSSRGRSSSRLHGRSHRSDRSGSTDNTRENVHSSHRRGSSSGHRSSGGHRSSHSRRDDTSASVSSAKPSHSYRSDNDSASASSAKPSSHRSSSHRSSSHRHDTGTGSSYKPSRGSSRHSSSHRSSNNRYASDTSGSLSSGKPAHQSYRSDGSSSHHSSGGSHKHRSSSRGRRHRGSSSTDTIDLEEKVGSWHRDARGMRRAAQAHVRDVIRQAEKDANRRRRRDPSSIRPREYIDRDLSAPRRSERLPSTLGALLRPEGMHYPERRLSVRLDKHAGRLIDKGLSQPERKKEEKKKKVDSEKPKSEKAVEVVKAAQEDKPRSEKPAQPRRRLHIEREGHEFSE